MSKFNLLYKKASKESKKTKNKLTRFFKKRKNQRKSIYIGGAVVILALTLSLGVLNARSDQRSVEYSHKLEVRQKHVKTLQNELKQVQSQKAVSDSQVQQKATHEAELQKAIDDLNAQLQAKRDAQSVASRVVNTVTRTQTAYAAPAPSYGGCGDNSYAQFIYQHESGCNLNAVNPQGCRGIGQACPGSKLPCGADYACQNAYFTNYANSRYGGWAGAYSAWLRQGWW